MLVLRLIFLLALALPTALVASEAHAVAPDSELIGCDRADEAHALSASAHLDPSCTYTQGFTIVASDVELDCQGARIATTDGRYGIYIVAPTDVALANVTVRNCRVEGFLNNLHVEREGFRELAPGVEYEHAFSNILIEDSTFANSRGVGVFIDGYVTGVTLRRSRIEGAGSAGIYLETGSKDNVVENNWIVNNGFRENGPDGQYFTLAGVSLFFWGTGREGLAIDGSRFNRIVGNHFEGNSAGGIFLYKNCGEFWQSRPQRWFDRRYGAHGNVIEGNTFVGGENGIWVGSRMSENTAPMECSDPAYYQEGVARIVLDHAKDNVLRGNVFRNVQYAIRVEDDRTTIEDNEITGDDPSQQALLLGTRFRTSALAQPVADSVVTGNRAFIAGNQNPYRWIHGHAGTTFAGNESHGRPVGFCEGVEPRRNAFIFVLAFVVAAPSDPPPSGGPPTFPPPEPLPPCPATCNDGGVVARPSLALRRLGTPPGDDTLLLRGDVTLPHPFTPALDPAATGVHLVIEDASGTRAIDVLVPGGAYDPATRAGWKVAPNGRTWRYVNRGATPPGGITSIVLKDLSRQAPGRIRFTIRGARGAYAVDQSALPLEALVVLDPPTAETGQCGRLQFAAPAGSCRGNGRSVVCR
ncbi:MAG TPA: right-handed parallel beta-helix repeat-containing protein [Candidatus Binatia bacterium]